jgi:hypothetical protein
MLLARAHSAIITFAQNICKNWFDKNGFGNLKNKLLQFGKSLLFLWV